MKEKLENMEKNIEIDKESLREEQEKIDAFIMSQSSEVFIEKKELEDKKQEVLLEIEELRRQLENKLAIVDTLDQKLEAKENEIDAIKSNYEPEFKKLNTKKTKYEEALADFSDQTKKFSIMETSYNQSKIQLANKIEALNSKIKTYTEEEDKYNDLLSNCNSEIAIMKQILNKENDLNSKQILLKMNLEQLENSIETSKNEIHLTELNNKKLESDIISLDLKVPGLEEEKAKYVTSKNFKEAGKVSAELKKLIEGKNQILSYIEQNNEKIELLKHTKEAAQINLISVTKQLEENILEQKLAKYEDLIFLRNSHIELSKEDSSSTELKKALEQINSEIKELEMCEYIQDKIIKEKIKSSKFLK